MKRYSERFHGRGVLSELNITPLLDLCFVLLIIFMISTPLMEQQMAVNLPKSRPKASNKIDPQSIVQVTVDGHGGIVCSKRQVTLKELELLLKQHMTDDPDTVVALRADAGLRYQELIDVLDVVKDSGAKLGLATVPEKRP